MYISTDTTPVTPYYHAITTLTSHTVYPRTEMKTNHRQFQGLWINFKEWLF